MAKQKDDIDKSEKDNANIQKLHMGSLSSLFQKHPNTMRALVHVLINPLVIFWIIIIFAWILKAYFKREKAAVRCLYTAIVFLFLVSSTPIPLWMIRGLEHHYPPLTAAPTNSSKPTHILVLGAGHVLDPRLVPLQQLTDTALERISEGVRIHKEIPDSKLIFSGYSKSGKIPTGEIMAQAAIMLGILPTDTLVLPKPHNTKAESYTYFDRFDDQYNLILVTSAAHMPRAMSHFQARGLYPIAAPCGYLAKCDPDVYSFPFTPSYHKIEMFQKALHEWIGLLLPK